MRTTQVSFRGTYHLSKFFEYMIICIYNVLKYNQIHIRIYIYGWLTKCTMGPLHTEDVNSTFQFQLFLVHTTLETGNSERQPYIHMDCCTPQSPIFPSCNLELSGGLGGEAVFSEGSKMSFFIRGLLPGTLKLMVIKLYN